MSGPSRSTSVRRLPFAQLAVAFLLAACGAGHSGADRPSASAPEGAIHAVLVIVRAGADPRAVAKRIAGPGPYFVRVPAGGANPLPEQASRQRRTYAVPVAPSAEQSALSRARQDPDVELAQLIPWPLPSMVPL